ncbi:transposase [Acinetobacter baumannii]
MDFKDSYRQCTNAKKKPRRTFTAEFKHQLIQQCQQPDTSVAKVAMQHQINANLLHKWIRQSRSMPPALKTPSIPQTDFLPVILHPTPVKQEAPLPPVPEKKAVAYIRIPLHEAPKFRKGSDDRDRLAGGVSN